MKAAEYFTALKLGRHYANDLTKYSKKELAKFVKWANKNNVRTFIVGGWAAFTYGSTYGSLDIDVVFRKTKDIKKIAEFYKANSYVYDKFTGAYKKSLKARFDKKEKLVEVWFDCFSFDEKNELLENERIAVSWGLLEKFSQNAKIGGIKIKIPIPELLLVYKAKALRDREWKLDRLIRERFVGDRYRLRTKIAKDIQDIKDIIAARKIDGTVVDELLQKTGFGGYFEETMQKLGLEV